MGVTFAVAADVEEAIAGINHFVADGRWDKMKIAFIQDQIDMNIEQMIASRRELAKRFRSPITRGLVACDLRKLRKARAAVQGTKSENHQQEHPETLQGG